MRSCGKSVHKFCTNCVQSRALYPAGRQLSGGRVHNPSQKALVYTLLIPRVLHRIIEHILSVTGSVMPTIHTTYKENNKSKILNSYLLYKGASL